MLHKIQFSKELPFAEKGSKQEEKEKIGHPPNERPDYW